MTIPSTISGGPSIFQVRMGTGEVLSAGDEADFLVAFYQHSYEDHIGFLKEGGVLLYDSDNVQPNLDDKRFVYVGIPITGLTVEALGGTAKDKGKNVFILGLLAKIFDLDVEKLKRLLTEKFGGKDESILNTALMAFQAGYAYPVGNVLSDPLPIRDRPSSQAARSQVTMDGNQALAYGLIAGGVRYGAAYPITPWSTVMETLRTRVSQVRRPLRAMRGRAGRGLDGARLLLCRPSCDHRQLRARASRSRPRRSAGPRWPRFRSSSSMSSAAARAPACRPMSSRATFTRRSSAATATARAWCLPLRRWRIAFTSPSRRRGSRANTARRCSSSAMPRSRRASRRLTSPT